MNELEANVEKYFRMLHPDFDQLESGEQWIASYDRDFLRENFYEIDSKFLRNSLAEIPG